VKERVGRPVVERILPSEGDSPDKIEEAVRLHEVQETADEQLLGGDVWD
jgi:hypothetical protein